MGWICRFVGVLKVRFVTRVVRSKFWCEFGVDLGRLKVFLGSDKGM